MTRLSRPSFNLSGFSLRRRSGESGRSSGSLGLLLALFLFCVVVFQWNDSSRRAQLLPAGNIIRQRSSTISACQPKEGFSLQRGAVVVFGEPRTGSTLLFELIDRLGEQAPNVNVLALYELFLHKDMSVTADNLVRLATEMDRTCQTSRLLEGTTVSKGTFDTPQGVAKFLEERKPVGWESAKPMVDNFLGRMEKPNDLIQRIWSIPAETTTTKKSYFAFKIFAWQLESKLHISPSKFIRQLLAAARGETKFVILWRRRMIESFVSQEIGEMKKSWNHAKTTADDSVVVDKKKLQQHIAAKKRYYMTVKRTLDALGIDYEVFEYERDLLTSEQQLDTIKRLQTVLGISTSSDAAANDELAKSVLEGGGVRKKQATVPLNKQIQNWDEVVRWGYSGETSEWEDLFPGK